MLWNEGSATLIDPVLFVVVLVAQDHNRTELELIDRIGIENFGQSQI